MNLIDLPLDCAHSSVQISANYPEFFAHIQSQARNAGLEVYTSLTSVSELIKGRQAIYNREVTDGLLNHNFNNPSTPHSRVLLLLQDADSKCDAVREFLPKASWLGINTFVYLSDIGAVPTPLCDCYLLLTSTTGGILWSQEAEL